MLNNLMPEQESNPETWRVDSVLYVGPLSIFVLCLVAYLLARQRSKVENVAFYHVNCSHHSELINSANKFLKNSRRSAFSPELQVRFKSSSSSLSNDSTGGLDPIPEPPVPCTEIAQSAVEIQRFFTEFRRSGSTPQPITESQLVDSVVTFSDLPHIYRRAAEPIGTLEKTFSTANEPNETGYHSIFDSIPEPPVKSSAIETSFVESAGVLAEPTFASQGLGGWWPSGWVQHALEFLHIDCGLPWWGSIVCGTLVLRLLMFPIVVISQRNAAKLNNSMPQVQYIQMKVTEARQRGDKLDAARYTGELMTFMKEKDVNPLKNMLPSLCQAPVFVSVFFGLRGIANVPVQSLTTGGILWFVDLTVPDQFYILPVVTSATLFLTLKLGVDGAPSQNMQIMKYVMMGLPVIMLPFISNFPGALLVYWTTSNFVTLTQVAILRIPTVREYFKIEKKIKHDAGKLPIKDKGFVRNIKDSWTNMKITAELQSRERADKMAFMKAGRDPIIKTYKYDPTQIRRQSSSAIEAKKKM